MILLLTLLIVTYLLIAYLSLYFFNTKLTQIARIIFGIALIIFSFTWLYGLSGSLWVILIVICLVINIEITAFKFKINDSKALQILHIFTIAMAALIIITAFML
ncbi:hypothetical protein ERX37_06520 [Macrococcus hajekii]|uniref:DUF1516 family protein n=1 Tax=Macrococcus hajekii TaxID=198482 RepID=A0A4R6BJH7_9STAP|nr:hypothetical protein [Macrococcus hajekii]TDM01859.1 hypothetical protein ERX37_06520 [Macrococcus hajekii]GGB08095.1 hypothetical protein GCM10007190_15060 [Macrococcus hajekii]